MTRLLEKIFIEPVQKLITWVSNNPGKAFVIVIALIIAKATLLVIFNWVLTMLGAIGLGKLADLARPRLWVFALPFTLIPGLNLFAWVVLLSAFIADGQRVSGKTQFELES